MKRFNLFSAAALLGVAVLASAASAQGGCSTGGSCSHGSGMHETSSKSAQHNRHDSHGFLGSYFEMRALLAGDKVAGLQELSKNLAKETASVRVAMAAGPKDKIRPEQITALKDIEKAASAMKTRDITAARETFKGLSRAALTYVKAYGCDTAAYSFYCDMAKESWLQETQEVGNPYYGAQMLSCGAMTGHVMNGRYMAK